MVIQNRFTNQPIADWRAGKISKEEASQKIKYIFRGGGGGSSSAVAEAEARGRAAAAAQEAKRKGEEESRRKAIEELNRKNAEIREQIRIQKQAKIQSQTIQGQVNQTSTTPIGKFSKFDNQVSGPQPLTVSAYNEQDKYTFKPYRQSFWAGAGMAVKSFGSNIVGSIFGRQTLKPISEHTEVLKYSEGLKRDEVAYVNPFVPSFGTVQTDPVTGKTLTGAVAVTYGDIQFGIEEKRGGELTGVHTNVTKQAGTINKKWQGKVDTGEITVEEAQAGADKEFNTLNENYRKQQEAIYKKYPDVPGVFERTGKARRIANLAPDLLVVGASAGIGLINPVAGASIATGYFTGKGIVEAAHTPTYKEIGEQGGIFAGVGASESGGFKILEPTALDTKFKGYRQSAGVNLLFGVAGGVSLAGAINKAYIAQELVELGESPIRLASVSKVKGDVSFDVIKGVQTRGGLTRVFNIEGQVIRQGGKSFILPSGQGFSTTTGRVGIVPSNFAGGDTFLVGVKGATIPVGEGYFSLGKGVIQPQLQFGGTFNTAKEFANIGKTLKVGGKTEVGYFAGASKKLGKDLTGAEYFKSVSGGINLDAIKGRGFKAFSFGKNVDINTFGINKVIRVGESSIDDLYRAGGGSTISGQVKGFGGSSVPSSLIQDFSRSSLAVQAKIITKPTLASSGVGLALPSAFAGTGQYERTGGGRLLGIDTTTTTTSPNSFGIMRHSQVLVPKVEEPRVLFGQSNLLGTSSRGGSGQRLGTSLVPRTLQGTIPISNIISRQDFIPRQDLRTKTIQKQITQQPLINTPPPFGIIGRGFGGDFGFGLPYLPRGELGGFQSKRRPQRGKQRTRFQTSFTGSILKIRGTGLLPGALSVRGILDTKINKPIKIL